MTPTARDRRSHLLLAAAALAALLLALLAGALSPARALADGDPGSDELLEQNLFYGGDDGLSLQQELALGKLLNATSAAGQPIRVAIIGRQDDLGVDTSLWKQPQSYAEVLGYELSFSYAGRLLVVTPNGFGVYWNDKLAAEKGMVHALGSLRVAGDGAGALVAATQSAVYRLEAAAGVDAATLAKHRASAISAESGIAGSQASAPAAPSGTRPASARSTRGHPDGVVIVIAVLLLLAYIAWRRGMRPPKLRLGRLRGVKIKPVALLPSLLLAIVVVALVLNHTSTPATGSLDSNPNLDPGTQIAHPRPAPNFTLIDEAGRQVSLSQYRGKVVVLAFIDDECQTICPLTTTMMLDAKHELGAAGRDVQLLGVNANWKSTQIDDVANYTLMHGLLGRWHFLTGTLPQLERVWKAYGVNEQELVDGGTNAVDIDHVANFEVIDPQGRLRTVYTEGSSYAAIPQQAQLLAQDVASLLPSHPKVSSKLGYGEIKGTSPAQKATLPRAGGGTLTLGPGKPHLTLFFASWDKTSAIAAHLSQLNAYARAAKRLGLPALTAIDEGSVEPSRAALPAMLETLPQPLRYPVAIDTNGNLADGYEVAGEPWFVLTSASGQNIWYQEIYTAGWPTVARLEQEVRAALSKEPTPATNAAAVRRDLAGSPPVLAALHAQAGRLLPGGAGALVKRLTQLHGHPVVINIWATTCVPCQKEFGLFANASAEYGPRVAFIGIDTDPSTLTANAVSFLRAHPVSYPSYQLSDTDVSALLPGGLEGTPTTLYIDPRGKPIYVHTGQYESQGTLDVDIEDNALSGEN